MSDTLKKLEMNGCDVEGALERCVNDEEFYISCFDEVLKDGAFERLGTCLQGKNIKQAFDEAHTLKGILANLGISPLYDIVVRIVEPLRAGSQEDLSPIYRQLMEKRVELQKLL